MEKLINLYMHKQIKSLLFQLRNKKHTNKNVIDLMLKRIDKDPKLVKSENVKSHFCAFFVPIHKKSKSIYLVHHIKALDWIPPGGHIEKNELPIDTVKREFNEELDRQLTTEKIELFDATIKNIKDNPRNPCWIHYDLWYLVYVDKLPFKFDKGEFYDANWFSFEEALTKIKTTIFLQTVKKISFSLHNDQ
jgi:8-oxo-dGTP pyrophosphatase MutT (NUDIX family)